MECIVMKRAIFNQKGGVGKTSISCNLAAMSAIQGYKTLLIDLDVQGNASYYLGYKSDESKNNTGTVAELLNQTATWFSTTKPIKSFPQSSNIENLDFIPSSPELEQLEKELERRYRIYKLKDCLDELSKYYDRIYLDTPPNLNFYSKSALIASNSVLIPFDCDTFSHHAVHNVLQNIEELKEDHNRQLKVEGIIVNQFTKNAKHPQKLIDQLIADNLPVLEPFLSASIKMKESHHIQVPLVDFLPQHKLSLEFESLHKNIERYESK